MKLELFQLSDNEQDLQSMIRDALFFFKMHTQNKVEIIQQDEQCWDIEMFSKKLNKMIEH